MGIRTHIPGQNPLRKTVADGVAGRIPAVISSQAIHHVIFIKAVNERIVRTVGKSHVDNTYRNPGSDSRFNVA